jgi:cardiolipin synthase
VIDGHVAYTGSQNLVDPAFKKGLVYEEMVARITGPVVLELQYVFVADWFLETEELLDSEPIFPGPKLRGDVPVQVLPSGPQFPTQNNQRLLVDLLYGARRRVVIVTPYFVPDEPFLQALQTAVLRGVEVHLVVSGQMDQLLVGLAQRSYYAELLENGVHVHQYRQRFLHAKHLSVDDAVVFLGSSNMDIRSFALNAEVSIVVYDAALAARLRAEQDRYLAHSEPLDRQAWLQRRLPAQFADNLARMLSPLL